MNKKQIPIFFACDDNYIPFLAVALSSLKENASREFDYRIIILNEGLTSNNKGKISKYEDENFSVEYFDIASHIKSLRQALSLRLRDYYSVAIYYRMFIPSLFKDLDKAIYLDGDIVVLGDISKFYQTDIEGKLVAAINDRLVLDTPPFVQYVEEAVGIKADEYFNSGVLVMNLEEFRKQKIEERFLDYLVKYNFDSVCPDQDYLNVLCRNSKVLLPVCWNKMPLPDIEFDNTTLNLLHYNSFEKPWRHDGVLFGDIFWEKARATEFYEHLQAIKNGFTPQDKIAEQKAIESLINNALRIAKDEKITFKKIFEL